MKPCKINTTLVLLMPQLKVKGVPQIEIQLATMDSSIPRVILCLSIRHMIAARLTTSATIGLVFPTKPRPTFVVLSTGPNQTWGATGKIIDSLVLCHEHQERLDFLFRTMNRTARILITFEPEYPEHFHMDDL